MDHIAIMRKSWKLTDKIMSGEKTIESRWYFNRVAPWDRIKSGETVYFKDSGEPVTIKAEVEKILQFSDLAPQRVRAILKEYGGVDGISIKNINKYYERFKNKRYCILVFLKNPQRIKPFYIDKKGYGIMLAWISCERIEKIKK